MRCTVLLTMHYCQVMYMHPCLALVTRGTRGCEPCCWPRLPSYTALSGDLVSWAGWARPWLARCYSPSPSSLEGQQR
ncbi:hypothetical protein V8C86DRAFT_2464389 [Haematococcus lacustris]